MTKSISRRNFLQSGCILAFGLSAIRTSGRVFGANERIRVGMVRQNERIFTAFQRQADAEIVPCPDLRRTLDRKDLDALVLSKVEHVFTACESGKDVYVEADAEIVEIVRKFSDRDCSRIVQADFFHRSGSVYEKLRTENPGDKIGPIEEVRFSGPVERSFDRIRFLLREPSASLAIRPISGPPRIEFHGKTHVLYVDDRRYVVLPKNSPSPVWNSDEDPRIRDLDLTTRHVRDFLDCVKNRNTPRCDMHEARESYEMLRRRNSANRNSIPY